MQLGLLAGTRPRRGPPAVRIWGRPAPRPAPSLYPEIDCVRPLLTPALADWAEQRAERLGIGADRALVTARLLEDETYIRSLAASLGITFEPLDEMPRSRCLLNDKELIDKAAIGLLPIADGPATAIVIAPSGTAARGLIGLIARDPAIRARFRLTTAERFNRFVLRAGGTALIRHASEDLKRRSPALAAARKGRICCAQISYIAASICPPRPVSRRCWSNAATFAAIT